MKQSALDIFYFEQYQTPRMPEKALLAAVLDRAFWDFLSEDWSIRTDAREWFYSKEVKDFSYLYICEHLDLEPAPLLDFIVKLREAKPLICSGLLYQKVPIKELTYLVQSQHSLAAYGSSLALIPVVPEN